MPGGKGTRSHTPAGPRRLHGPPARGTPAAPPLPGPSWEVWLPTPPAEAGASHRPARHWLASAAAALTWGSLTPTRLMGKALS